MHASRLNSRGRTRSTMTALRMFRVMPLACLPNSP